MKCRRIAAALLALAAALSAHAADVKISALPAVSSSLSTTDLLIANEGSTTRKATPPQVVAASVSGNGLINRTGSTTTAAYAGTSCTNQFVRSLSAAGAASCATVGTSDLAASLTLTTPVLGVATGTSLGLSTSVNGLVSTMVNSDTTNGYGLRISSGGTASTRYALRVNNADDSVTYLTIQTETGKVGYVGIGTDTPAQKLDVVGNIAASGSVTGNTVVATTAIASSSGGTGNSFTKFTGPTSSEKTFTLPDATSTILTSNAAVTVVQGGTGQASFTNHGVVLGQSSSALVATAAGTAGQLLRSGGSAADPAWTTPTYPNTATNNKVLTGDGTNVVLSTPTLPVTSSPSSGRYMKGDGTNWISSTGSASGTGACGANTFASTLNSDAAPTCTQPAAANLSDGTTGTGTVALQTQGTWTPTDVSGASLTFSAASGVYIRTGDAMIANGFVTYPSTANGSTAIIGSLPCTVKNLTGNGGGSVTNTDLGSTVTVRTLWNSTQLYPYDFSGNNKTNAQMSLKTIQFSASYICA